MIHWVLVHGYGARGNFWDGFAEWARRGGHLCQAVDLNMASLESALESCRQELVEAKQVAGPNPVVVVGHSLGAAILLSVTGQFAEARPTAAVGIAAPFGTIRKGPNLWRFLARHRLIPESLIRSRFFGPTVPLSLQKRARGYVVRESPSLRQILAPGPWFHSPWAKPPLPCPWLFLASQADHIVGNRATAGLARQCGVAYEEFPRSFRLGHNDVGASPLAAQLYGERILSWFTSGPGQSLTRERR